MTDAQSDDAQSDDAESDDGWWVESGGDSAPARRRKPATGTALFALAPLAALVGVLLIVIGSVVLDRSPYGDPERYARVSYDTGSGTVLFRQSGTYLGYVETTGDAPAAGSLRVVPVSDAARIGTVRIYERTAGYALPGRRGTARWTLRIEHAGAFQVDVRNAGLPAGSAMTFGRVAPGGLLAGTALVLPGALLVTVAVGLIVLGLLLRRRHRRAAVEALVRAGPSAWG